MVFPHNLKKTNGSHDLWKHDDLTVMHTQFISTEREQLALVQPLLLPRQHNRWKVLNHVSMVGWIHGHQSDSIPLVHAGTCDCNYHYPPSQSPLFSIFNSSDFWSLRIHLKLPCCYTHRRLVSWLPSPSLPSLYPRPRPCSSSDQCPTLIYASNPLIKISIDYRMKHYFIHVSSSEVSHALTDH